MRAPISGPIDLTGKAAIVTGAARGVGQATCLALAREGANVVACDVLPLDETVRKVETKYGQVKVVGLPCDISREDDVAQVVNYTINNFGRIDIFVGNAAIAGTITPPDKGFMDVPLEEWDDLQRVNARGVFICLRAVWPVMEKQKSGKIVLIGTLAVKVGGVLYGPYYAATKATIHTVGKWLAKRGATQGIYVNVIAPGPIATPMGKAAPFTDDMVPLGRLGEPEDIAEAIIFLASDASNFITGTVLDVNGGMLMD